MRVGRDQPSSSGDTATSTSATARCPPRSPRRRSRRCRTSRFSSDTLGGRPRSAVAHGLRLHLSRVRRHHSLCVIRAGPCPVLPSRSAHHSKCVTTFHPLGADHGGISSLPPPAPGQGRTGVHRPGLADADRRAFLRLAPAGARRGGLRPPLPGSPRVPPAACARSERRPFIGDARGTARRVNAERSRDRDSGRAVARQTEPPPAPHRPAGPNAERCGSVACNG